MSYNKQSISKKFSKEIFPIIESYEEERKNRLIQALAVEFLILILTFTFGFATTLKLPDGLILLAVCLFCVFFALLFILPIHANKSFKTYLKTAVLYGVLKYFKGINLTQAKHLFSLNEVRNSTLFSRFDKIHTYDSFKGTLDCVNFKFSELKLEFVGQKYNTTSFRGIVSAFSLNKKVKTKTIITTRRDMFTQNSMNLKQKIALAIALMCVIVFDIQIFSMALDNILSATESLFFILAMFVPIILAIKTYLDNENITNKIGVSKNEIKLEDVKFAKRYKVYSDDEVEARYLVTTAFMERLMNISTAFGTLMIAISTNKDLFEFGSLYKSVTNINNVGFLKELMSILDMVEYFKLNEKTGL